MSEVRRIGIVGCGQMGGGIAQTAAQQGFEVRVREAEQSLLNKGLGAIHDRLDKAVGKGKLEPAQRDAIRGRIRGTLALCDLADCDIVIEAITENLAAKQAIFRELDGLCPPSTILASNTSSISITAMAAVTQRPDRFIGMHFFNPVPVMKLVEIVRTIDTSEETFQRVKALGEALGKATVTAKDTPGFICNLLLIPYILGAVRALDHGVASARDIDTTMKLGCNHPMGPLELADFVGLDTCLYIADVMFEAFKDGAYAAPPLLRNMVTAGRLGVKSGRGFLVAAQPDHGRS